MLFFFPSNTNFLSQMKHMIGLCLFSKHQLGNWSEKKLCGPGSSGIKELEPDAWDQISVNKPRPQIPF